MLIAASWVRGAVAAMVLMVAGCALAPAGTTSSEWLFGKSSIAQGTSIGFIDMANVKEGMTIEEIVATASNLQYLTREIFVPDVAVTATMLAAWGQYQNRSGELEQGPACLAFHKGGLVLFAAPQPENFCEFWIYAAVLDSGVRNGKLDLYRAEMAKYSAGSRILGSDFYKYRWNEGFMGRVELAKKVRDGELDANEFEFYAAREAEKAAQAYDADLREAQRQRAESWQRVADSFARQAEEQRAYQRMMDMNRVRCTSNTFGNSVDTVCRPDVPPPGYSYYP